MLLCNLLQFLKEYQVIMTVIIMLISGTTFYFLIENRCSCVGTKYELIKKEFNVGNNKIFVGNEIEFTVINKTNTMTIIRNSPSVMIRCKYGFNKLWKYEYVDVTNELKEILVETYPLKIINRKDRVYIKYKLTVDFYNTLKPLYFNKNINEIEIYLSGYNDVSEKEFETNKCSLKSQIAESINNYNLNTDKIVELMNKMDELDEKKNK